MQAERKLHAESMRGAARGRAPQKPKPARVFGKKRSVRQRSDDPAGELGHFAGRIAGSMALSAKVDKGNAAFLRIAMEQIARSLSSFPFIGSRAGAMRCIAKICLLHKDPVRVLDAFRQSYEIIEEIAETIRAGRKYPVAGGLEQEAEKFEQDLKSFTSITGLMEIQRKSAEETNGSFSTYEIPFVTRARLERITSSHIRSYWSEADW